ncbi:hypothetical protein BHM03_00026827, partial [Ensete ventricosum]
NLYNQGLQFQFVPPCTGSTYRSVRLPVCGPPATGRYRQKSNVDSQLRDKSIVDGRLREKLTVGGRLSEKKGRRRRRGKEEEEKKNLLSMRRPHPRAIPTLARGDVVCTVHTARYRYGLLKEHMKYCVEHPEEINKLAKVKAQVSEVKGVMMENIEKVMCFAV